MRRVCARAGRNGDEKATGGWLEQEEDEEGARSEGGESSETELLMLRVAVNGWVDCKYYATNEGRCKLL